MTWVILTGRQNDIDQAARPDAEVPAPNESLVPMAGGNVIVLEQLDGVSDLDADQFRLRSSGNYSIFLLNTDEPLSSETISDAP